ncbi:MAG TPA: PorP/SprF family type IX secretion system membrane protein [Bacteroidia bacterium]|nr:PorP/SprF family type IX secretion system membrane protein [Bacteroidia bacterium]
MKKNYLFVFFILSVSLSFAQQIIMHDHFFYKPMIYNPAFTGKGNGTNVLLIHHAQWTGFKAAPQLSCFTLDRNFMDKKIGLGLGVINSKAGINSKIGGSLFYSHRLNINDNAYLALGLSGGVIDYSVDFSKAIVENSNDPTLFEDRQHKITYDANAGVAFVWKGLELGGAALQAFENKITYANDTASGSYNQARHYIASIKNKFIISKNKNISIVPLAIVRMVANAPLQYSGNINFDWNDKFWVGATYKNDYAITVNAGFCIAKRFSVGYSYDVIQSAINTYAALSHEIMVGFKFGRSKKEELAPEQKQDEPVKTQEPVVKDSVTAKQEIKVPDNTNTEHKVDSILAAKEAQEKEKERKFQELQEQLKIERAKLKQEELLKQQTQPKSTPVKAGTIVEGNNDDLQKGYYVIVGAFYTRAFAESEVKRFREEGFKETNLFILKKTKFNYVYMKRVDTKNEALLHLNDAKKAGTPDAWIYWSK